MLLFIFGLFVAELTRIKLLLPFSPFRLIILFILLFFLVIIIIIIFLIFCWRLTFPISFSPHFFVILFLGIAIGSVELSFLLGFTGRVTVFICKGFILFLTKITFFPIIFLTCFLARKNLICLVKFLDFKIFSLVNVRVILLNKGVISIFYLGLSGLVLNP